MDIWKYYDSCWRCRFSVDFFFTQMSQKWRSKKGTWFLGCVIPPSSTWGYQTILDLYPETWGKWSKISRAYFSDWLEPLLLCSVCVTCSKQWNPKNQRLCSPRSSQVSFWIIYIWWEWLKRVGWDVVLFLFQNNMELVEFRWCLPKWFFMVPLKFFWWSSTHQPSKPCQSHQLDA